MFLCYKKSTQHSNRKKQFIFPFYEKKYVRGTYDIHINYENLDFKHLYI